MSAVRYDSRTVAEAKRLADAGWEVRDVRRILSETLGISPSRRTVRSWVDPEYAERKRAEGRAWISAKLAESWSFRFPGRPSRDYQEAFIRRLDREGVPMQSIAKVCAVVFPDDGWTRARVAYLLGRPT